MKFDLKKKDNHFLHFYVLNSDISLIIEITIIKLDTNVKNIHMEGLLSQMFYLGLSSCFRYLKKRNFLCFFKHHFLDSIK